MQRYFVDSSAIQDGVCIIRTKDVHHIKNVMRFRVGDRIIISQDGLSSHLGVIESISDKAVSVLLKEAIPGETLPFRVTLAQALIRKEAFELVIEKATELGVKAFIPTICQRSIIKLEPSQEEKKQIRYQAIAKEASEQSERQTLPVIEKVTKLVDIDFSRFDHILFGYERESENHIKSVISFLDPQAEILFLIGPEGGISQEEKSFLEAKGGKSVSLGKQILRSETAGIMAVASFLYEWGNQS